MTRYAFQTAMRGAAVTFLTAYKASAGISLQIYRARPRHIAPPTAFVDSMTEVVTYTGLHQRQPRAEVVVIHGLFDSGTAVDQRDAFVDGFLDWALDHPDGAGANTTIGVVAIDDDPTFVPEWVPEGERGTYYATRITLEGLALSG